MSKVRKIKDEPVLVAQAVAVVTNIAAVLVLLGFVDLDTEQVAALALAVQSVLSLAAAVWARFHVSPSSRR